MAGSDRLTPERRDRAALFAALDAGFATQRALPPQCLAAIRAWQRTDRAYEAVQRLARDQPLSAVDRWSAQAIRAQLLRAFEIGRTPFALTVYRGVRSFEATLGVPSREAALDRTFKLRGYLATSVLRAVALAEFTTSDGALLEIRVPTGTPAIWVAGAGAPALRRQGELLLDDGVRLQVTATRAERDIGVLSTEIAS